MVMAKCGLDVAILRFDIVEKELPWRNVGRMWLVDVLI